MAFDDTKFITEIIETLKQLEDTEAENKRRSVLANIIGRLGTWNEIKHLDV